MAAALLSSSSSSSELGLAGAEAPYSPSRGRLVRFPLRRAASREILWWPSGIEAPTPNLQIIIQL